MAAQADAGPARGRGIRRRAAEPAMRAALAPVREAMLRRARERAAQVVAQARSQADEAVAQARRDADDTVASAREAGRAQAAPHASAIRSRGRQDARARVLGARREAYDELRARVRADVARLRDEPEYGPLVSRWRQQATLMAGPGATVAEDPAGGVVARAPGVVVDCSLPRLADTAIEALGGQVAWLWTPGRRRERA